MGKRRLNYIASDINFNTRFKKNFFFFFATKLLLSILTIIWMKIIIATKQRAFVHKIPDNCLLADCMCCCCCCCNCNFFFRVYSLYAVALRAFIIAHHFSFILLTFVFSPLHANFLFFFFFQT